MAFLGKSVGKILTAIFGWAVVAFFGRTSPKENTRLSGLVGAAAAWPILVVGVAFPRLTTFIVSFIPLSDQMSSSLLRIAWLGLALLVPLTIGVVAAAKAPPDSPRESFLTRMARGFPITLGISVAFILMFITVPVLRVMSAARGRKDDHVPCITSGDAYNDVARTIDRILELNRIDARRSEPSWWLSGPSNVLRKLGGEALRGFMPDHLAYDSHSQVAAILHRSRMCGKE